MPTDVIDRKPDTVDELLNGLVEETEAGLHAATARWEDYQRQDITPQRADGLVSEFLEIREHDPDAEPIDAVEDLRSFMGSIARVSVASSADIPEIFAGGDGQIGFMWYRPQGDCYLYANLATKKAQWVRTNRGKYVENIKDLDMNCQSEDWLFLVRKLRAAHAV